MVGGRRRPSYIRSCTPFLGITLASLLNKTTTSTVMRFLSVLTVLAVMVAVAYGAPGIIYRRGYGGGLGGFGGGFGGGLGGFGGGLGGFGGGLGGFGGGLGGFGGGLGGFGGGFGGYGRRYGYGYGR
ncbi:keratin-associated protein 19-2-like [Procambarus clarkii]|uniref:keratin-associated protein 19-2-like n=2 Tax=Procambarus clarkii TaxID=6728 RepID=UPI001E6742B6|nr:WW domain-containing protein C660.06-like [Procambarus clarkii]